MEAFRYSPFKAIHERPPPDLRHDRRAYRHGLFNRFDNLRVSTEIEESGSSWVLRKLFRLDEEVLTPDPRRLGCRPDRDVKRHARVSPYYEATTSAGSPDPRIGSDHVLLGSDWPHAEGIADPARSSRISAVSPTTRSATSCGRTPSP